MNMHEAVCQQYCLTHHALPYLEKLADLKYSITTDKTLFTDTDKACAYAAVSWQCIHDGTYDALAKCVGAAPVDGVRVNAIDALFQSWGDDTVVVLVEPHPDDGILGTGGFVQSYINRVKDGVCVHPLYDCVAVSGSNAVDESFVAALSDAERDVLLCEYDRVRSLQERLLPERKKERDTTRVVKGARRVFFEHVQSWAALVGQPALTCCDDVPERLVMSPVLLPCYERGELPDEDDRVLMRHACASFLAHAQASRIVCVCDMTHDPHGTHQWVFDLLRDVVTEISQETGCRCELYGVASGSWDVLSVSDFELFSGSVYFQPLTNEMMHRKIEAFLQHSSQVLPQVSGENPLAFHERMVLAQAYHAQRSGVASDTHPFAELLVMN